MTSGVELGLDYDTYRARPGLSVTSARKLLPPFCPAIYRHTLDHPDVSDEMDFGQAAHNIVTGSGPELVVVQADSWRTKAAQEERAEARAAGKTPILAKQAEVVAEMVKQLRAHPLARILLDPEKGDSEVSLFWTDPRHLTVQRKGRLDHLPDPINGRRRIVPDYKTATSSAIDDFAASAARYGYHMQAAGYLEGLELAGIEDRKNTAFVFLVQMREPPFLVSPIELDPYALQIGQRRNERAVDVYAECVAADHWPDYTAGEVARVALPGWYERQHEIEEGAWV